MKKPIVVGLCLAALAATAAGAHEKASADQKPRRHVFHHGAPPSAVIPPGATAQVLLPPVEVIAVPSFFPHIAPYPNGNLGDVDGLSRDVNDCNKGCISEP